MEKLFSLTVSAIAIVQNGNDVAATEVRKIRRASEAGCADV